MTVDGNHHKRLFSRFGVEAGFLPDLCLIASAMVILLVRLTSDTVATVTPLAIELTIVQVMIGAMCWAIRQYSIDSTRKTEWGYATLPRQTLMFLGITSTLTLGLLLTSVFSPERGLDLFLLLILGGNVGLFFLVALFVVETIPLSRVLLLIMTLFAGATTVSFIGGFQSKTSLSLLIIWTMGVGIFLMLLLCRRTGRAASPKRFLRFLRRQPLFTLSGPLYLFGFWLDKWLYWFFIDNRSSENGAIIQLDGTDVLLYPASSDMSGVLAALFTIPAIMVAFYSFSSEISRNYLNFSQHILGSGTMSDIDGSRDAVGKSLRTGVINTTLTQVVFSAGLFFFAESLEKQMGSSVFTALAIKSSAIGVVFFVWYAFLFRALLYFEDPKVAFWSGVGFCMSNICFTAGMMFFDVSYGGIGLALASLVGIGIAYIPLRRRLNELDYLFFTQYK